MGGQQGEKFYPEPPRRGDESHGMRGEKKEAEREGGDEQVGAGVGVAAVVAALELSSPDTE